MILIYWSVTRTPPTNRVDRIMIDRLTPRWAAVDCRIVGRTRVGMEPRRAYPSGSRILIYNLLVHTMMHTMYTMKQAVPVECLD